MLVPSSPGLKKPKSVVIVIRSLFGGVRLPKSPCQFQGSLRASRVVGFGTVWGELWFVALGCVRLSSRGLNPEPFHPLKGLGS